MTGSEMSIPMERSDQVIARQGFEKELYTHDEVFDDIRRKPFTIKEASEYFEVAEITVRRWVKIRDLKSFILLVFLVSLFTY